MESHLSKKQPQPKIPIVFLFSQICFNIITSRAVFHGGHIFIRSKRSTVQNQRITLTVSNTNALVDTKNIHQLINAA